MPRPMSHDKHVNENMSNMLCHVTLTLMCGHVHSHTYVQSQRPVSLPLCKVNMSNSITIRKSILQGSRSGQVKFNLYRNSKVGGECAETQTQAKKLNSITIGKLVLRGSKVGSGQIQSI